MSLGHDPLPAYDPPFGQGLVSPALRSVLGLATRWVLMLRWSALGPGQPVGGLVPACAYGAPPLPDRALVLVAKGHPSGMSSPVVLAEHVKKPFGAAPPCTSGPAPVSLLLSFGGGGSPARVSRLGAEATCNRYGMLGGSSGFL